MKNIKIKNIEKRYDDIQILNGVSFDIEPNTITALVGPNGCGKSTLLNILSGIDEDYSGNHNIQNKESTSYIFQNYRDSLLPWRSNYKNISLPLEIKKMPKELINKKISELQEIFQLNLNKNKFPYQLSGGQQQQLAFMRALVNDPKILFIDEPFSALDYETNLKLRDSLQKYHAKYKPTIFMITHNIEEAVHLADKIIVLSRKPTKIIDIINNKRTNHRPINYLKGQEFNKVKNNLLDAFQKAVIN